MGVVLSLGEGLHSPCALQFFMFKLHFIQISFLPDRLKVPITIAGRLCCLLSISGYYTKDSYPAALDIYYYC